MNISQDIHISILNQPHTPYHQVPHYYLRKIAGFDDCQLFIFFPELLNNDSTRSSYLSENEYARFINILLNIIHECLWDQPTVLQHYPNLFEDAKRKAMARQQEQGVQQGEANPRIQIMHYFISSLKLHEYWTSVRIYK